MKNKVVITSVCAITPIGNDIETIAKSLLNGQSGINYITRYNAETFTVKHAGEVDTSILNGISYPMEGNLQFKLFYYCLRDLLKNIKHNYSKNRIGCIVGTDPNTATIDDFSKLFGGYVEHKDGNTKIKNKTNYTNNIINMNPSVLFYHAAKDFNINGPCICNLGTCSASTQAIGTAYKLLKNNQADLIIAGGVSSKIDPISITRLCRLEALEETQSDLRNNCRPFDKNRRGFTISEGCVLFTIEREEDAKKRNAQILCEVKGYGAALDGFSITDPHEEALGMSLSMQRAIEDAGLSYTDIDYINAHGTGTVKNDLFETKAIKQVFKDYAYNLDISSTKSMHGHLMTAAGAMEVLVCLIAIRDGFVPPTINYDTYDENCDLNYTPQKPKLKKIKNTLTNSFGLGGQNATLVISGDSN